MKSTITKTEDGTITLAIAIPKDAIATTRAALVADYVKNANLPGFRKGKAPQKLVEEKMDIEKLNEEILKKLLPTYYVEAIKEHNIQPIVHPKVHVGKIEEGKDWEFTATTCEAPQATLKDYKKAVKDITAKSKIVVPGKDLPAGRQENKEVAFDEVMKTVLEHATVTIPSMLIDQEVDRLLSQTLDEIKTLGLTLDQYLASTKKTAEELRKDYAQKAENDIKIEFVLQKIADEEKIVVEDKEVAEAITKAKSDAERANLEANRYLLANILRQQKTLDFLKNL